MISRTFFIFCLFVKKCGKFKIGSYIKNEKSEFKYIFVLYVILIYSFMRNLH